MKNLHVVKYVTAAAFAMAAASPLTLAADSAQTLVGKNYVQEFDNNGAVKRTIVTGNVGDGTDAIASNRSGALGVTGDAKDTTELELPNSVQGDAALDYLGGDLDKAASKLSVTPEKLQEILADNTMHLDTATGKLFVVDTGPDEHSQPFGVTAEPEQTTGVVKTVSATTTAPTQMLTAPNPADAFLLHSNKGASKTIYLNFLGMTVTQSVWSNGTIKAPAYNLPGSDVATFDINERNNIYTIWSRVAEDYLPFDVDVTTEPPTSAALYRVNAADNNYGTIVTISGSNFYNCGGCGGVAYIGIVNMMNTQAYSPAWVFQLALNSDAHYIAEAASHEAGHTLGLYHDGSSTTAYYLGHGTGATSWAPIMGAGYYTSVSQWSAGAYPTANNQQDDIAVFAASGFPVRTDDYGNTAATAATLPIANTSINNINAYGIVETSTDKDVFVFNTSGSVSINVNPALVGANLDIVATLTDASGKVLQTSNPATSLSASINVTVPTGTYYLTIAGIGKVAVSGDAGYPTYGSLGQYQITGTVNGNAPMPPVATVDAFTTVGVVPFTVILSTTHSTSPSPITGYAWNFGDGSTSTDAVPTHTYTKVGTYTVSLTITNAFGLTGTYTIPVVVNPVPALRAIKVNSLTLSISTIPLRGVVQVKVTDNNGVGVSNASVIGTWSGYFTTPAACVSNTNCGGVTDGNGVATIVSGSLTSTAPKTGTATYTVTDIWLAGTNYNASKNLVTLKTITR